MQPFFLDGGRGRLYCLYHAASTPLPGQPALLHLPAFADEMNKSRRMVALAARELAAHGVATLVLDPFGTGDSEGDHGEADWQCWSADACCALDELRRRGHQRIGLWGLRSGCLLAADLARTDGSGMPLLLWQPVLAGEQFLNQFLRLRVAGATLRGEGKETVKDLRALLAAGESVEIAGYTVSADLAEALASRKLEAMPPATETTALWFDVSATGSLPGPAATRAIDIWREAGDRVEARGVAGEPFWSTVELSVAANLVAQTADGSGLLFPS